jgi:hypothetical protein
MNKKPNSVGQRQLTTPEETVLREGSNALARALADETQSQRELTPFRTVEDQIGYLKVFKDGDAKTVAINLPKEGGLPRLMAAIGTQDQTFLDGFLHQLLEANPNANEREINFVLSVVKGIGPRDQLETMLAAQMAVLHMQSMKLAGDLDHIETMRVFMKSSQTFAGLMETINRYRSAGEQKVTVQNVSLNGNAQAIVGNVTEPQGKTH